MLSLVRLVKSETASGKETKFPQCNIDRSSRAVNTDSPSGRDVIFRIRLMVKDLRAVRLKKPFGKADMEGRVQREKSRDVRAGSTAKLSNREGSAPSQDILTSCRAVNLQSASGKEIVWRHSKNSNVIVESFWVFNLVS